MGATVEDRQRLAAALLTLAILAAMGWLEMPPWQRELVKRTVRHRTRRLLHRLARAHGHRAMGDELAGRQREAESGYAFTERIMRAHDAL